MSGKKNKEPPKLTKEEKQLEARLLAIAEAKLFQYAPGKAWHIKLQRDGHRHTFSTKKTSRAEAAIVAKEIRKFLTEQKDDKTAMANTIAVYDPAPIDPAPKKGTITTIGDLIKKVEKNWPPKKQQRTLHDYIRDLRRVVSEIKGLSEREAADKVRIADITRGEIAEWRNSYVKRKGGSSPAKIEAAGTSSNSILRGCKAMFGEKLLEEFLEPEEFEELPNPFRKVVVSNTGDHRFRAPAIKAAELLTKAAAELGTIDQEAFKVVILTLCLGLRRNECDKLEWRAIDLESATLHVGKTEFLHPKSPKSIGTLEVEPEVLELLRGWKAKRTGNFVMESEVAPRTDSAYAHYRCVETFERLTKWLRASGIDSHSPIHDLRKMFGSAIEKKFGIYAASLALRHADIAITASHYLSKRDGVVSGLGAVLANGGGKVIPIKPAEAEEKQAAAQKVSATVSG